jgi:hypothetical protein
MHSKRDRIMPGLLFDLGGCLFVGVEWEGMLAVAGVDRAAAPCVLRPSEVI